MQLKQNGALGFTVRPGYSLCLHTEIVMEFMFKKYLKILLVNKAVINFILCISLLV